MERKPNRQDLRSARTRAALVDAARPLFAQHGYAGVSTEAVVGAAGVTRGALYHQFLDKADLFAAVVEQVEAAVTARVAAAMPAEPDDPLAALAAGVRATLALLAEPGIERIVLIDAPSVLGWERVRAVSLRHGLGLVLGALDAARAAGLIAGGPTLPLAHALLGALDEGALYAARAEDPDVARDEVGLALERLLDGLRTR